MLDLRGKILLLAFFTLSGFTCYKEVTLFDEFTLVAAPNADYPEGYYRVIVTTDDVRYTTFDIACGKTENYFLKYNTTYGSSKWLDRNQCLNQNEYLQSENEIYELNSRPYLDLLQVHFSKPGKYLIDLRPDDCFSYNSAFDILHNQTIDVKSDTSVLMGVIPDSSQYLRIELLSTVLFENTIKTGTSLIEVDL